MLAFNERRALRTVRNVETAELTDRLAQSIAAVGSEVDRTSSLTEVIASDYETGAITPAQSAAFREYVILAAASVDRFTADLRVLNDRLGHTL